MIIINLKTILVTNFKFYDFLKTYHKNVIRVQKKTINFISNTSVNFFYSLNNHQNISKRYNIFTLFETLIL